jgi:hypothetical protein
MKNRILLAIAGALIFGLAVAAFAYTNTNTATKAAVECCCAKGAESCPMKGKDHADKDLSSCCDKDDCCCKTGAESCPMKSKDDGKSADKAKHSCCDKEHAAPKKEGEAAEMKHVVAASGTEGCCPCCGAKKEH